MCAMLLERTRQGKLAQPMAHHVLSDEHRVENFAIMDLESMAHKLRSDNRPTRPSFDGLPCASGIHLNDFVHQVMIDKRSFFN